MGFIVASTKGAASARVDRISKRAIAKLQRKRMSHSMTDSTGLPEFADVEAAAVRIAPYAYETPLIENAALNEKLGGRVFSSSNPSSARGRSSSAAPATASA